MARSACWGSSARVREALDRLDRGDVRFRFVLDLSDLD
jgi:alcohol dehydrogenase (NADP+)